ncbi:hypothetical protein ACVWYH_007162 [Bradyrhizobium sp. GM24.11]
MTELTEVELLWLEKRIENRIRFGRFVEEKILDRRRRLLSFAPGSIFAFVRWTSNDFGTAISRIDILRAVAPGQRCSTVPYAEVFVWEPSKGLIRLDKLTICLFNYWTRSGSRSSSLNAASCREVGLEWSVKRCLE